MNTQDEAAGMIGGLHYINGDNEVLILKDAKPNAIWLSEDKADTILLL